MFGSGPDNLSLRVTEKGKTWRLIREGNHAGSHHYWRDYILGIFRIGIRPKRAETIQTIV